MLALILAATLCAAVAGVIGTAFFGPTARARRLLERGSTTVVDGAIVSLTGTVKPLDDTRIWAPFSATPCLMFAAKAIFYESLDAEHGAVTATLTEVKLIPFILDTEQGPIHVEGDTADLLLEPYPLMPQTLGRERSFFTRHGRNSDDVRTTGFTEAVLVSGARVRVRGMALLETDPEAQGERGYRADAPRRVRLVAHADHPLSIARAR